MSTPLATCPNCGASNYGTSYSCHRCAAWLQPVPAHIQAQPYFCRLCGSPLPPQIVKRLGGVGWFVLLFGLLFCLVGALFSLFFIEEHRVCPACGGTVG